MPDNEIYTFLKNNNLTEKTQEEFEVEYSAPEKAKELHGFFEKNNLTEKDYDTFYGEYLKKKDQLEGEVGEDSSKALEEFTLQEVEPTSISLSKEETAELDSYLKARKEGTGFKQTEGFRTVKEKMKIPEGQTIDDKIAELKRARVEKNKGIIETMLPKIDMQLDELDEKRKDVYDRQREFMSQQEGFKAPAKEEVEVFENEIKHINRQNIYLKDAKDILNKADRYLETSDAGVFESLFKGSLGKDFFSLGISEVIRDVNVLDVAKKMQAGEEISKAEEQAVYAYAINQQLKGDIDPTVASMIGSGVRESIPFMIQLALTSPGGAVAKKTAQEGIEALLKKIGTKQLNKYVLRGIGEVARAGVQSLGQTQLYGGTVEKQIGAVTPKEGGKVEIDPTTQMSATEAFGKSYAQTFGTVLIERGGGIADDLLKSVSKRAVQKNMPKNLLGRVARDIQDATSFNGFISENVEELVDQYYQSALEGEFNPKNIYTGKELLATMGSVAFISGPLQVANMAGNKNTNDRAIAVSSLKESENKLMPKTVADIDRILQGDDIQKNAEQLDIYLKTKKAEGATPDDLRKVVDYAAQRQRMDSISETENDVLNVQQEKAVEKQKEAEKGVEKAEKAVEPQIEEKLVKEPKIEVESKIQEDEKEMQKQVEDETKVGEDVDEKVAKEKIGETKQEVLKPFVDLAIETESSEEFIEKAKNIKNVPEEVSQEFYDIYGEGGKLTPEQASINFYDEVKAEEDAKEQQSREMRVEGEIQKGESIRDKDMPEIDRPKLQDREKGKEKVIPLAEIKRETVEQRAAEARSRIGDIVEKKPTQLIKQAKSVAELDYLNELYPGQFTAKEYKDKKARLEKKGLLEDTQGRITDIQSEAIERKAKDIDVSIENTIGADKYAELKAKKAAEVDKLVNSIGNLANIKRAVGDGKKLDVGRELVQVASSLAKLGMINVELGTRQVMDKLKDFLGEHAPNQLQDLNKHENLIARELGTREYDKKLAEANIKNVVEQAAEKVKARDLAEAQVSEARKKPFKDTMQRMFVDEANPFKIALLKMGGPLAQRAVDYFNTQAGMSGRSEVEFSEAQKKILGPFKDILNTNEQNALQEYLNYNRVIELDKLYDKRGQNRLKHEGDITLEESEVTLSALMKNDPDMLAAHNIGEAVDWDKVKNRAQEYYNTLQGKLADMYKEGLISEEVYKKLSKEQPHYTPRRYLTNFIETTDPGGSISGIEALSGGSTGSVLTDTQTLLADVIARTNSAIARNRTMKSLNDVAIDTPNDVVKPGLYTQTRVVDGDKKLGYLDKLSKEEERLGKLREKLQKEGRSKSDIDSYIEAEQRYIEPEFVPAPAGYTIYKFKDKGQTKSIYLNNDYVEDFVGEPDAEWVRKLKNVLSWVSGNKILKAFATGYNPEFAIKNLPLDMMHILTTTEAYSPVYPVATAQLVKDIAKVSKDAWQRKGRYKDFVEEGGSLEYLATQGSLSPRKFKNYNRLNIGVKALLDAATHVQNTSEILTRLALRERMIDNYTKEFGKNNNRQPNNEEKKEIQVRATAYARNYLDFAQGGKAIKFMNSVIPYLNAGFQVTRGSLRAAQRNPKVFWSKMAQLGATATAITAYNLGMYRGGDDEEKQERKQYFLNDISDRRKADNFIIMTNINYEKDNKKHYVYFAFPKDNAQKVITGWFEGLISAATGEKGQIINEQRWMEMQSLIQNVADIGNLPPIQSAILGSQLNKDLYYRSDLWSGKDLGKYKSQEIMPGVTPNRFIKAGEFSEKVSQSLGFEGSLSPVRLQYFVSQFTTKSNVIGTIMGEIFDVSLGGLDSETEEFINRSVGEQLITQPFSRRFFKKTSPYVKESHAKKEMQKLNAFRQRNDNRLKPLLKAKRYTTALDFVFKQKDPIEMQRLLKKVQDDFTKMQGIDYRIRELAFVPPQARARAFHKMWKEADAGGKQHLLQGTALLGYFSNEDFMGEITQLMSSDPEFSFAIPE